MGTYPVYKSACAALLLALALPAFAQNYPAKPIRVILPFAAGSSLDAFTRALAAQAAEATGQPMPVENRPGASQIIGMSACAKAPSDGYTACMATADSLSYNVHLF